MKLARFDAAEDTARRRSRQQGRRVRRQHPNLRPAKFAEGRPAIFQTNDRDLVRFEFDFRASSGFHRKILFLTVECSLKTKAKFWKKTFAPGFQYLRLWQSSPNGFQKVLKSAPKISKIFQNG
jgi:hypothetical protein